MATLEKKKRGGRAKVGYQPDDEPITQYQNADTGHWILRDKRNGRYVIGGDEPFDSVKIRKAIQTGPHPAVSRELALRVEKAMIEYFNEREQKTN